MHTAFLMLLIGLFAGTMGAILGIGGGMIITPIITLGMGLPIKYAIGASIIAVIATSTVLFLFSACTVTDCRYPGFHCSLS